MSFDDIINQRKAKDIITGQLRSGKIPHAYLFLGPDGVGRRKTALELAKALNCLTAAEDGRPVTEPCDHCISCRKIDHGNHPDVRTVDLAWQAAVLGKEADKQRVLKIDTVRALQHEIGLRPAEGRWKVFLVEPADKITTEAANCLLKTLEEPPPGTMIVLIGQHRDNLPATIVSRTQVVAFRPLLDSEVADFLTRECAASPERASEIARLAEGSLSWAAARMNSDTTGAGAVWERFRNEKVAACDALSLSGRYAKTAAEFLVELLGEVKHDFRDDPARFRGAVEAVIAAQGLVTRNVNAGMVLDTLFLKLSGHL